MGYLRCLLCHLYLYHIRPWKRLRALLRGLVPAEVVR